MGDFAIGGLMLVAFLVGVIATMGFIIWASNRVGPFK